MTSRPSGFQFTRPGRLRLYNTKELLELPAPSWLVKDHIPHGGVIGMYGPPGGGKSFVALDLALSVASDIDWQGQLTEHGFVVYIAAEGGFGLPQRTRAWLDVHNRKATDLNIAWLIEAVAVNNDNEDLERVFDRLDEEVEKQPALIIIDTLARCFDGNENEQVDMGRFIKGVDAMRMKYGATILIVHHTNVGGLRERGNTAFRGAADTMMKVEQDKESGDISVVCDKQKDAADFDTLTLSLQIVPEFMSAVIVPAAQTKKQIIIHWLKVGSLTFSELKSRASEVGSKLSVSTLKRVLRELLENDEIIKENGLYSMKGQE